MRISKNTVKRLLVDFLPWRFTGFMYSLFTCSIGYPRKFRRLNVGSNSYVDPSVQIIGWKNVEIGSSTILSEDIWINVNYRDDPEKKITIGNNCHIGRRNFFSSGPFILIKDYCLTGIDCHFLGCGHNLDSPMLPYIASGPSSGAGVEIGVNCWLATSVTVFQGVKIGHGSIIGARSMVTHSIPPFSIAFGNPCKVVKRYDFKNNKWVDIKDWLDDWEQFMPNEENYLSYLIERNNSLQPSLIAGSRRFGWLK